MHKDDVAEGDDGLLGLCAQRCDDVHVRLSCVHINVGCELTACRTSCVYKEFTIIYQA